MFTNTGPTTNGTPSVFDTSGWRDIVFIRPRHDPVRILNDFVRFAFTRAQAPQWVLLAHIAAILRCFPRPVAALVSACRTPVQRTARQRAVHHGEHLLNVHRMPA